MATRSATPTSNNGNAGNGTDVADVKERSSMDGNFVLYTPSISPPLITSEPASRIEPTQVFPSAQSHNPVKIQHNHERLRLAIVLVVMLAYLVFLGVMFYLNTSAPVFGITGGRAAAGRWAVTWVMPGTPAYEARVQLGALIVSVDGKDPSSLGDIGPQNFKGVTRLALSQGGKPILLSLSSAGNNPIQRWTYALLGLIFISVGGPVFVKARQRKAASTFYIFCVATALCFASAIGSISNVGWTVAVTIAALMLFACSFTLFFFEFPVPIGKTAGGHNFYIALTVTLGLILLAGYVWALFDSAYDYDIIRPVMWLYMASCVLVGIGIIVKSFIVEQSPDVRQQLVLLLGGTGFAVSPTLFLSIIPMLLGNPKGIVSTEISAVALGIMPLAFAYAITQHQLLGVHNFVRRGVIYLIMGSSVLLVFSLIATALGNVMPSDWERSEIGLISFGFLVFFIAFSYSRLQVRVERLVDKHIYHDAYDYKEALLQFSSQLASEQKLQALSDQLVGHTCRLMNLMGGALLLAEEPDAQGSARTGPLHGYTGLSTVILGDIEPIEDVNRRTTGNLSKQGHKRVRAHTEDEQPIYLEAYAVYGEVAYELLEGLQDRLSQLGIELHQPDGLLHAPQVGINGNFASQKQFTTGLLSNTRSLCASNDVHQVSSLSDAVSATHVTEIVKQDYAESDNPKSDLDSIRSFLGVPLWTRSRFVGMLCLAGKKTGERFTKDDLSLLSTLGSQAALAIYNAQLHEAREKALLDTIAALARSIEAKDGYTIQHCENMTGRAVAVAQALSLTRQEVDSIRMGAILHDIGKIGIPDAILNKPDKLTSEEYEEIKKHAAIGAGIVQSIGALHDVVPIVLHHQERYDGSGYPDRISGTNIPIGARIIGVVDTYGAMTEDRVYRKAPGHSRAVDELQCLAGKQFDPTVVDTFIRLLEERPELAESETPVEVAAQ